MAKKKDIAKKLEKTARRSLDRLPLPKKAKPQRGGKVLKAAGVVAASAAVAGVAAVLASRRGVGAPAPGQSVYHVQHDGGRWEVRAEGASKAVSTHATKKEASAAGRELARSKVPSRLLIHGLDGKVLDSHDYEPV